VCVCEFVCLFLSERASERARACVCVLVCGRVGPRAFLSEIGVARL
jgi:hypothetical protein